MKVIAVVPAFRSSETLYELVRRTLEETSGVIVVDDACPEQCSEQVRDMPGVTVIKRQSNGGVGAATKDGIKAALESGADFIVKIDADLQMLPESIPFLLEPLYTGNKDFVKATRFNTPEDLEQMPIVRLIGNAALSLISKFSSGYWTVNDPTNGFIAMNSATAKAVKWEKVADDYFFESDLLFRLRLVEARVSQVPMKAIYQGEVSSLRPMRQVIPFLLKNHRNYIKRILYLYLFREWNLGSIYLPSGLVSLSMGLVSALFAIAQSYGANGVGVGTVVLASLGLILGAQFLLQFLLVDMQSEPK